MRIPTDSVDREQFFLDLIQKCLASREERKPDYASLRSWYLFGNGPVKGFAVTLSIGIVSSMFSAILLTRMMIAIWLKKKRPQKLNLI